MTLSQAQTELAQVNAAISAILSGGVAAYASKLGISVTKLSLKDLREQRRELEFIVSRLTNGAFTVAKFRDQE